MRPRMLISGLVVGVLLIGASIGAVMAQSETPTPTSEEQQQTARDKYLEELSKLLGIERSQLEDAADQARQTVTQEVVDQKVQDRLAAAVEAGRLTQEEADQVKTWWDARPDAANRVIGFGLLGRGRGQCFGGFGMRGGFKHMAPPGTSAPEAPSTPAASAAAVYSY